MTEQTLLVIFIGLVALSLVGIAAVTVAVGWQAYRLLFEVRLLTKKVHGAGDELIGDFRKLRAGLHDEGMKIRGVVDFILSIFSRKARSHRAKSADTKSD